jgi:nucleotide-binding universal stress UspA family protein
MPAETVSGIVLVAVDFGDLSEGAVRAAAALAARGACRELHMVHVLSPPPTGGLGESPTERAVGFIQLMEASRARLDALGSTVSDSVERLTINVRVGRPDVEIAQLASDLEVDVVVVGTHGKKGIERLVLGSVAESVVRNAPCPVFVYRPRLPTLWDKIVSPCVDCVAVRSQTKRARLFCERHSGSTFDG